MRSELERAQKGVRRSRSCTNFRSSSAQFVKSELRIRSSGSRRIALSNGAPAWSLCYSIVGWGGGRGLVGIHKSAAPGLGQIPCRTTRTLLAGWQAMVKLSVSLEEITAPTLLSTSRVRYPSYLPQCIQVALKRRRDRRMEIPYTYQC